MCKQFEILEINFKFTHITKLSIDLYNKQENISRIFYYVIKDVNR